MTPKEKAKELVMSMTVSKYREAESCALTAAENVLDTLNNLITLPCAEINYWKEVKQEIILLWR